MDWSPGAEQALDAYCERIRTDLAGAGYEGADPDEVAEDIRRHVSEELLAEGITVVTRENVERALAHLGTPLAFSGEAPSELTQGVAEEGLEHGPTIPDWSEPAPSPPHAPRPGPLGTFALAVFGVIVPAAALVIEMRTGMCADGFFDPIPTPGHALAIALVPLANLLALWLLHAPRPGLLRRAGIANAMALAISGYYAVLFLPLLPLAVIGLIFMGLGLLPLSPLLSLIVTLRCRWWLWKTVDEEEPAPVPGLVVGALLGFGLLAGASLPHVVTDIGLHLANSDVPATSQRGVRWLRMIGDEQELLERCYVQPLAASDIVSLVLSVSDPVTASDAREVFYRVTGRPFNTSPPPRPGLRESWRVAPAPFVGGDLERGGDTVGERSGGLYLASSRIDAQVDAAAAFAYTEWTLSFENRSPTNSREARALLALPPGGVVSRLTLWIDGEEREAAFAARSTVRGAYEEIVRMRRDPVLVTSVGHDRVLLQCFPVLPAGGTMMVRVGITAPLELAGSDGTATRGYLRLPSFAERNFAVGRVEHAVWIEAGRPLDPGEMALMAQDPAAGRFALRGTLDDRQLSDAASIAGVERDGGAVREWTPVAGRADIEQVVRTVSVQPAQRIVLVVDGSAGMARNAAGLARAIEQLPVGSEFTLLIASDAVETAVPLAIASARTPAAARAAIERVSFVGGKDAVPALIAALDVAIGHAGARILWIHGAQPTLLGSTDALLQFADRCSGQRLLHDLQIAPGPNLIARALADRDALVPVPRAGAWEDDLARLLHSWGSGTERFVIDRRPLTDAGEREGPPASKHVARLWAAGEVERLITSRGAAAHADAVALAVEHQLVTRVTGAVVLETEQQYERAGLEPVAAESVPILPEPELVLIVLLAALVGVASFLSRRRTPQRRTSQ